MLLGFRVGRGADGGISNRVSQWGHGNRSQEAFSLAPEERFLSTVVNYISENDSWQAKVFSPGAVLPNGPLKWLQGEAQQLVSSPFLLVRLRIF